MYTPKSPTESFQSITVTSVPSKKQATPTKTVPNITSISVVSKGKDVDSRAEHIPRQSVQSVITVSSSTTIPRGQVVFVSSVLNPKTGRKLSLEQAIESGLLDMKTGLFYDMRTNRKLSLSEAARLGFIDKDFVKQLQQKCGVRDPVTNRELSILEAMQKGYYDPMTGQVSDPRTGQKMTLEQAAARHIISPEAAQTLSYISIQTSSKSKSEAFYGMPSLENTPVILALSDALDKGLYIPGSGRFLEPISREEITLHEAIQRRLIDANIREIVHPVTGQKLTLQEAINQDIVNPQTGQIVDPRSHRQVSLDEAQQRGLIQRPLSLHTVLTEGIMDETGQIKDQHTGKKMTLGEALDRGVLDLDFRCILDPRSDELLSLQEAITRGLVSPQGYFVETSSGRRLSIHDAINEGLAQVFSEEVHFPHRGIRDTATGELLTLSEAIRRGCLDPTTAMFVDNTTGRRMSIEEAVRHGLIDPELADQLSSESGLRDIVGSKLSVLEVLKRGLLDPLTGEVKDPTSGQTMAIQDAVKYGLLTSEDGQKLLSLTSAVMSTQTVLTEIKPSVAREKPIRAISVNEAVMQGLIDEDRGVFRHPATGQPMALSQAVEQGYLLSSSEWDDDTVSSASTHPSQQGTMIHVTHDGLVAIPPEEHVSMQEADHYVRDIEDGKEEVSWSERKDFHALKTEGGVQAVSTQEAKMSQVKTTSSTDYAGDVSFPIPIKTAIAMKLLDTQEGVFRDPTTGEQMPLEQAIDRGLLSTELAIFIHPVSQRRFALKEAIGKLIMDGTGHFTDPRTQTKHSLEELIRIGIVVLQERPKEVPHVTERKSMIVRSVLDPRTGEWLDSERARRRKLLDMEHGAYTHPHSGDVLTISEAIQAGYVKADVDETGTHIMGKDVKTRSYDITDAVDPTTGQLVDVATALRDGIIDQANGMYIGKDRFGHDQKLPISEAIKRGLVLATSTDVSMSVTEIGPKYVQETQSCTIRAVVDPSTHQQIPVSEAIKKGILDQGSGQYVNPITGQKILISDAIEQGLIAGSVESTESITDTMEDNRILASRQTTYILKSVLHPVTGMEISVNEAIDLRILDKGKGQYNNIRTGEVISLSDAIDKNFVTVEVGHPTEEENDDEERVPSIHIDDDLDAQEEMTTEEVTEITKKFQITGVTDSATGDVLSLDEALERGVINEDKGVFYDTSSHKSIPIPEALNKGLIVGCLVESSEEQELFRSDVVATRAKEGDIVSVINPISGLAVSATQAMQLGLLSQDKKTYYDPATDKRIPLEEAIARGLVNPSEGAKRRAQGPQRPELDLGHGEDEFGPTKARMIIDWNYGVVRDGRTGEKISLHEAVQEGFIDQKTADLLSRKAETMPFRGLTRPHEAHEITITREGQQRMSEQVKVISSQQSATDSVDDTITLTIQKTKLVEPEIKSIRIEEPMEVSTGPEEPGKLSYVNAVKLGLFNIWSGRFTDPSSGKSMTLQEAINRGLIDDQSPAIVDIKTGRTITLHDALVKNLVSTHNGRINEAKVNEMGITLDPQLVREESCLSPVNFEDAILSGLLDLDTGLFRHPKTGEQMTLGQAVGQNLLDRHSTIVVCPNSGQKITIEQALKDGVIDDQTGDFIDSQTKKKLLTLKGAVNSGLLESAITADSELVMDWQRGVKIPLAQAIVEGKVDQNTPAVYDPSRKKRVSLEEAKHRGLVNPHTGELVDPTTGKRLTAKDAAKLGLLAVAGAPVLAGLAAAEGVRRLTQTMREKMEKSDTSARLEEKVFIPKGQEHRQHQITSALDQRPSILPTESASREAHGARAVDMSSEVHPVQVEMKDGHFKASQKFTTSTQSKQVKEVIKHGQKTSALPAPEQGRLQMEPSPATTEYHQAEPEEPESVVSMAKIAVKRQTPYDVDISVQPKPGQTIQKPMAVEISLQPPREQTAQMTQVKTSTITEMKRMRTVQEGDKRTRVSETQVIDGGAVDNEEWQRGHVLDHSTGRQISVQEAIDRGLIEINWETGYVIDTVTREHMTAREAHKHGLIDSHIANLIETRMRQVQQTVPDRMTLNEAVTRGLAIIPLGRIRHPKRDQRLTIKEAIDVDFIDPDYSIIIDPANGRKLTVSEAINQGLMNPHTGDVRNLATGKTLTFSEMCFEGLIPEHGLKRPRAMPVQEAIDLGLIDMKAGTYMEPNTKQVMDIRRAVQLGYLESRDDEPEPVIEPSIRPKKRKTPEPVQPMTLGDAMRDGLIDSNNGTFRDPYSGEVFSLVDAIRLGFIIVPERDPQVEEGIEGIPFQEALERGLIDVRGNTFIEPITRVPMPLDAAIRKGYVILPAHGVSVHIETKAETRSVKRTSMSFTEAVERGCIDVDSGVYSDPSTGATMALTDAIKYNMIDPMAELVDSTRGMSLTGAIEKGLFNPSTGAFTDPNTGRKMSLTEALKRGFIDKESVLYETETCTMMTLEQAIQEGRIDVRTGEFIERKTGRKISMKEAAKMGLLAIIGAPVLAGMAVTEAIRKSTTRRKSHKQVQEDTSAQVQDRNILEFTKVKETTTDMDQSTLGMPVMKAIQQGLLDPERGTFNDPGSARPLTIKQAIERGLLDPQSVEVYDPQTGNPMDLQTAISRKTFSPTGQYVNPATKTVRSFRDAMREGIVAEQYADQHVVKKVIVREKIKLAVESVVDPRYQQKMSLDQAIAEGIIETDSGTYRNPGTGDSMHIGQAYEEGLIRGRIVDTVRSQEEVISGGKSAKSNLNDVTSVIDPVSRKEIPCDEAVNRGILDPDTGRYIDPRSGQSLTIETAIERGFVLTKETITTMKRTYQLETEDQPHTVTIRAIFDPRTGKELSVLEAIREGIFAERTGQYIHPQSGESISLDQAIAMKLVRIEETVEVMDERLSKLASVKDLKKNMWVNPETAVQEGILQLEKGQYVNTKTGQPMSLAEAVQHDLIQTRSGFSLESFTQTHSATQRHTFNIKIVIDPITKEQLHPTEAVDRGILDLGRGVYVNPQTGESMPIHEAYELGLIKADEMEGSYSGPVLSATAIMETKSYTVTAAIDTRTGEKVPVEEALNRGLLDQQMAKYHDLKKRSMMSIQEAIDCGLVIAHEGVSVPSSASVLRETTSYAIKSVIDSRTGEEIPISDAVRHKIVDRSKGEYVDLNTDEVMPISLAITKGLVITDTIDAAARKSALVEAGIMPLATVYSLKSVKDPNTGVWYNPTEAERRGLINKIQGMYIDPITARSISIKVAIDRGFIKAEEVEEPDYDDLPQDATTYATIEATREAEVVHITTVTDLQTGEEVSLMESVRRGIMDPNTGTFRDKVTGNTMTLQDAIEQGYIKAHTKTQDTLVRAQTPKLTKSYHITGVVDTYSGQQLTVSEAIRRGMVDTEKGLFIDVITGDQIPLDKAIEKGHVKTDGNGRDIHTQQVSTMQHKIESQSFFREAGLSPPPHREDTGKKPRPPDLRQSPSKHEVVASQSSWESFLDVGPDDKRDTGGTGTVDKGGTLYTEAKDKGLIDAEKNVFYDPVSATEIPLDQALDKGLLIADIPVKIKEKERVKTKTTTEITTSHVTDDGKVVAVERFESISEPTPSEDSDSHSYAPSSTDGTADSEMTFQEALYQGLIDMQTREYINPVTGDRFPVVEALDAGLLAPSGPGGRFSLEEAIARGCVDPKTGRFTNPKTGQTVTVDEAILLGFLSIRGRSTTLEDEESQSGVSFAEALERGLYDPVTGNFTNPHTGRSMPLDEAIRKGLVKPKLPSAAGDSKEPISPKRPAPPTPPPRPKRQKSKDGRLPNGKPETEPVSVSLPLENLGALPTNGHAEPSPATNGHVHEEEFTQLKDIRTVKTPDVTDDSSEGARTYVIKPGFQIVGPDIVLNISTGEVLTLEQALERHIAEPSDHDVQDDQMSGFSTNVSSIFEKVSSIYRYANSCGVQISLRVLC